MNLPLIAGSPGWTAGKRPEFRHVYSLGAAFAVRLLVVFLVFSRWGVCLQLGDSINWIYGSLGIALGRPDMYMPSLFWPPAFKLLAAGSFMTFGYSVALVQTIETLLGLVGIALAYRLALRLFGPAAAFTCGLLAALLPIASALSLSGLAEPLYLVLIEVFFLAYLTDGEYGPSWRLHAAATLAMAAAVVTRYEALGFYAAFVGMEAWRFARRRRRPGALARLLSAALVPLAVFSLWLLFYHRHMGEVFFWIRVTRDGNAAGHLSGLDPTALVAYVIHRDWLFYSWFCFIVPAAAAGLWADASLRKSAPARILTGAALGNLAALLVAASVRLISSDSERNFYAPFVLLLPYTAFLLTVAGERFRRVLPRAAPIAAALLAAFLARRFAQMAWANSWCSSDDGVPEACELGTILKTVAASTSGRVKNMICRDPRGDFSCVSAAVCSGLVALAERPLQPTSDDAYLVAPCASGNGALLARSGEECLYQAGARAEVSTAERPRFGPERLPYRPRAYPAHSRKSQ